MRKFLGKTTWLLILLTLFTLAACSPSTETSQTGAPADTTTATAEEQGEEMMDGDEEMAEDMDDDMAEDMGEEEMVGDMDDDMAGDMAEEEMAEEGHDEAMDGSESMMDEDAEMASDEEMAAEDEMMVERPVWQEMTLVNAATGASFTLADFEGKAVYVEPMATWCGNCRRQLQNVQAAFAQSGAEDVVFIALSLETNLAAADLAAYAEREGFDFTFSVLDEEMLQALVGEFGRSLASAPSTPHFIIRPDGSFTQLETGFKDSGAILDAINAARS